MILGVLDVWSYIELVHSPEILGVLAPPSTPLSTALYHILVRARAENPHRDQQLQSYNH